MQNTSTSITMMAISPYLSRKIKVLSFVAICMVLFIHAYYDNSEKYQLYNWVQSFVGNYVCRVFLPLFFIISGYLFYVNVDEGTWRVWTKKWHSRIYSLLIPYVIWNILFVIQMVALKHLPISAPYINTDTSIFLPNSWGGVRAIFIEPANFPLWFIKHLMLIVLFAPIIWYLTKKIKWAIFIPLIVLSFYYQLALSFLFFSVGAYLAIEKIDIATIRVHRTIYLLMLLISIIFGCIQVYLGETRIITFYLVLPVFIVIWQGYDLLVKRGGLFNGLNCLLPFTFFIYVFHEPAINLFKKIILRLLGGGELGFWLGYLLSPILMVYLSFLIGRLLMRYIPRTYGILTGNRTK